MPEGGYESPSDVIRHPAIGAGVCGEMNARNRMGGYNGFRGFIWEKDSGQVLLASEQGNVTWYDGVSGQGQHQPFGTYDDFMRLRWADYCRDR